MITQDDIQTDKPAVSGHESLALCIGHNHGEAFGLPRQVICSLADVRA
jgi:hypothetical protein